MTLLAIAAVAYVRPVFLGDTFAARDHLTHTLPAKSFLADSLRAGHVPEWWDRVGLGVPFAANPNHSALYPGVWPVAVLPMPWGIDFILVLHLALAGIGLAFFCRRLGADPMGATVAGAAFMLCGFSSSTVVHGGPLFTLAWLPWIAWAADRLALASSRRDRIHAAAVLALFQGIQVLAGDPSFVIITGLIALAVVMVRTRDHGPAALALAAAYVGAVLLSAVVIVPALYLLPETSRAAAADAQPFGVWSMHPVRVLEWVWPAALGDPTSQPHNLARAVADSSRGSRGLGTGWALGLYLGLPTLLLAGYGVAKAQGRQRWFAAVAAVFVLLALGRYTPVYGVYRWVVLPERLVRYPEKHIVGAVFFACVFAGLGLTALMRAPLSRRAAIAGGAVCGVFVSLIAAVALSRASLADWLQQRGANVRPALDVDAAVSDVVSNGVSAAIVVALFAGSVYLMRQSRHRSWAAPLTAAIVVGDLVFRSWGLLPLIERDAVTHAPPLLLPVMEHRTGVPRIYRPQMLPRARALPGAPHPLVAAHNTAIQNSATRFGFAYLRGYDQALSARMYRLWHAASASGKRMLDLYAVDYAVLPYHVARATNMPVMARTERGDIVLARNPSRRPRAFVAPAWQWYADDTAAIRAMFPGPRRLRPQPPPRLNTVRLAGDGTGSPATDKPRPTPRCDVRSPDPEYVELICEAPNPGYAVLLDSFAPGWTAQVDGVAADIERADVVARAVKVGPGQHKVVFRYKTPGLRLGALVSLLAWLNLLVLFYILRRWRPRAAR